MKFIEFAHPEGGTFIVHIDHITAAHFRRAEGEVKTRLALDLDERQAEIVLFGDEAERTWEKLRTLIQATA